MLKKSISNERIIETSAILANKVGLDNLTLKMIASELNIKSPSLYNHISSLSEIKNQLMIYGWHTVENKMIDAAAGMAGYDALKSMGYAFYDYAINNKGVFTAMLWYNMNNSEETLKATERLHEVLFRIMQSLDISKTNMKHIIRLTRSFLEGFCLLVSNDAFINTISTKESFDISLEILVQGIKHLEGQK